MKEQSKTFTVLIADDHQLFRQGMEGLLRKMTELTDIWHASDGDEAVKMVQKFRPSIVFMDIRMPEMNGIDATRLIMKKNPATKVLGLTMLEDRHHVINMIQAGACGYLLKNTSFDELRESIHAIMRGERYFSKAISNVLARTVSDYLPGSRPKGAPDLTEREKEIIGLICRGFTSREIAEVLSIATKTVETHRAKIYTKLAISNTAELAFFALEEGIVCRSN